MDERVGRFIARAALLLACTLPLLQAAQRAQAQCIDEAMASRALKIRSDAFMPRAPA